MNNLRLAIRNSLISLMSLACRLTGSALVFIVIARLPSIATQDFGQLTYAVALSSMAVLFAQFGLMPLLVRDAAVDRTRLPALVRNVFAIRIVLSIFALAGLLAYVQTTDLSDQGRTICIIMASAMFIGSFSVDLQSVFQSRECMHLELLGIAVENGLLLAGGIASLTVRPSIVEVAYMFLAAKSIGFALNYVICVRQFLWVYPVLDVRVCASTLREALPFAITSIVAAGILQLDTIMLRELCGTKAETAVGVYQAASRLFLVPLLLPEMVLRVFLPQFSRMHGGHGESLVRNLGRVNNILLTLGLLIGLVAVVRGTDLVRTIYGDRYEAAGQVLQLMGVTMMMRFGAAYNLYFTLRNRIWFRVLAAGFALCAVAVFNAVFIPAFGVVGAAYSSIASHVVYWIPYLVAVFLSERTVRLGWNVERACIAGAVLFFFMQLTSGLSLVLMLPVYSTLIAAGVFWTMSSEDSDKVLTQIRVRLGARV